jgi:hypothetical protein
LSFTYSKAGTVNGRVVAVFPRTAVVGYVEVPVGKLRDGRRMLVSARMFGAKYSVSLDIVAFGIGCHADETY